MKYIHVLHIITSLNLGGAETMLTRLILENNKSKNSFVKFSVISLGDIGEHGKTLQENNINVVSIGITSVNNFPIKFFKLVKLIKKIKPDVIQTWMVHADLIGGIAAKIYGSNKIVWNIRTTDFSIESKTTQIIRKLCIMLSYYLPKKIICAAHASLNECIREGYDSKKLLVIPNGFDVSALRKFKGSGHLVKESLSIPAENIVVGCVGRFNEAKDHATFINAAEILSKEYKNISFILVGKGLDKSNKLINKLISDLHLKKSIYLLGERLDVPSCYDAFDVYAHTSISEGFPNVIGEAMSMSIPCVSTDVGDASLLIDEYGLLVEPEDYINLAKSISYFIKNRAVAKEKASGGLNHIIKNYSISAIRDHYIRFYVNI